jgi:ribosomal protein L22
MDPKLLAILKKSKQVENATNQKYGKSGGPKTHGGNGGGLFEQIDGGSLISAEEAMHRGAGNLSEATTAKAVSGTYAAGSEEYTQAVDNSNLPPAIREAMKKNPIPQADTSSVLSNVTQSDIDEIRGVQVEETIPYSEGDEVDFVTETRHTPKRRVNETVQPRMTQSTGGVSESQIKKMIAEEIARVLPNVIENYFDKKVIKENMKLMKYVIKSQYNKRNNNK